MELAFIWVKKIRNLENIGFTFDNDFEFSFDSDHKKVNQAKKNQVYVNNLFGQSIKNLSAIVGENGTGKSTIFYLIKNVANDLKLTFSPIRRTKDVRSQIEYIALFKIEGIYYIFTNFQKEVTIREFPDISNAPRAVLDQFECFYYANFFDYSAVEILNRINDLSTTAAVGSIYESIKEEVLENDDDFYDVDILNKYKLNEISSQIQFISKYRKQVPFNLPSTLKIKLNLNHPWIEEEIEIKETNDDLSDQEEKIEKELERRYIESIRIVKIITDKYKIFKAGKSSSTRNRSHFKLFMQGAALTHILGENLFYPINSGFHSLKTDITQQKDLYDHIKKSDTDQIFIYIVNLVSQGTKKDIGAQLLRWIDDFANLLDVTGEYNFLDDEVNIHLSQADEQLFLKLISILGSLNIAKGFFDIYWDGLSSGENALLTLFSRFHRFSKEMDPKGKQILILFDECEINFHPSWQRKLVYLLTSVFPELFKGADLQFFVSSHSPLILSDVPKSNIIFLKKFTNGMVSVASLSDKKQTFAANIHTLLSDAFFMEEGTIGEIAKEKINWIIDLLNRRSDEFEEHLSQIESLVEIIGEPVIKSKLISMINEKQSLTYYKLNERLRLLEAKKNFK